MMSSPTLWELGRCQQLKTTSMSWLKFEWVTGPGQMPLCAPAVQQRGEPLVSFFPLWNKCFPFSLPKSISDLSKMKTLWKSTAEAAWADFYCYTTIEQQSSHPLNLRVKNSLLIQNPTQLIEQSSILFFLAASFCIGSEWTATIYSSFFIYISQIS